MNHAKSDSVFPLLDLPLLVQSELVKYLCLDDLLNLIEATSLHAHTFTPIGMFPMIKEFLCLFLLNFKLNLISLCICYIIYIQMEGVG